MSFLPDWLTGYDSANADAALAADKQLQDLNAVTYGNNTAVAANRASELANGGYGQDAQRAQIDQTFNDKLASEYDAVIGTPLKLLGASIWAAIKAVPVWVWIGGALVLFFWLGGGNFVRAWAAKKSKA